MWLMHLEGGSRPVHFNCPDCPLTHHLGEPAPRTRENQDGYQRCKDGEYLKLGARFINLNLARAFLQDRARAAGCMKHEARLCVTCSANSVTLVWFGCKTDVALPIDSSS